MVSVPSTRTPSRFGPAAIKRHKVGLLVAAWALLITVFALFTPSVTVREQTHPAQALPRLDQAVGDAAGLLAGKSYGYAMTGLTSQGSCDITPVRSGEEYSRTITVYTGKKHARDAVTDLYDGLRERYSLQPAALVELPTYTGTSADYVDFELRQEPAYVVWHATTGCRPAGAAVAKLAPAFTPGAQSVAFLRKLGVTEPEWESVSAECGDLAGPGGTAVTVSGTGELPADAKGDVSKLADTAPDDVKVVVESKTLVSYRIDGVTHAISLDDRTVTVTATEGCDG